MWEEGLRETYGELWSPDLVHSTCAFELFDQWVKMGAVEASELQRRAMAALGALPAPRGRVMVREKKERAAETENNDWEEGSVKTDVECRGLLSGADRPAGSARGRADLLQ